MSTDVFIAQMARMDERLSILIEGLNLAHSNQKDLQKSLEDLRFSVKEVESRTKNVETQLATAQPTIQEFITIKHKVVGAGAIGKWLWVCAAGIIGWIAASRETLVHWLSVKGS